MIPGPGAHHRDISSQAAIPGIMGLWHSLGFVCIFYSSSYKQVQHGFSIFFFSLLVVLSCHCHEVRIRQEAGARLNRLVSTWTPPPSDRPWKFLG